MTPEMILAIGTAIAAIISAFYARRATVHLPTILTLVNSQYGASLLATKVSANLLADKEPENKEYRRLANEADAAYTDHVRKQKLVDARSIKGAP